MELNSKFMITQLIAVGGALLWYKLASVCDYGYGARHYNESPEPGLRAGW